MNTPKPTPPNIPSVRDASDDPIGPCPLPGALGVTDGREPSDVIAGIASGEEPDCLSGDEDDGYEPV